MAQRLTHTQSETVLDLISEVSGRARSDVVEGASLADDLGLDSLDVVELTVEINLALNLNIDAGWSHDLGTVDDVLSMVARAFAEARADG